jgi:hypothetical protein
MAKTKTPKKKKDVTHKKITSDFNEQTHPQELTPGTMNEEKLKEDTSYIELPDVSDIPGQENIVDAGIPAEMSDETIASDDEEGVREGKDILEEDDDVKIVMGTEADVTPDDLTILGDPDQDMDMNEDELVRKEGLDDRDADGDFLNEAAVDEDSTGDDLDIPDADESDPASDAMGQGDEENNYYSLGGDNKDELNEGREGDEAAPKE